MLQHLWSICCSLKLAIIITSIATVVAIPGSLLMHFNPDSFANLDALNLSEWSSAFGQHKPLLSAWFYLTGVLLSLLALNTLCCFIDWLFRVKARWRKAGEYLIHFGFVLIIIAYFWGSFSGTRSEGNIFQIGQTRPIKTLPGHYLRLDAFEAVFNTQGRPVDMLNTASLLKGDQVIQTAVVKTNEPLLYKGLTVAPASFGQETIGYNITLTGSGKKVNLTTGKIIELNHETKIEILRFLSDAVQSGASVQKRSSNTNNPAILVRLTREGKTLWRGWYFLRQPMPVELYTSGFNFIVNSPLKRAYSVLTINFDPGLKLALFGAVNMTIGVGIAMFSFYYKRRHGDRPEII